MIPTMTTAASLTLLGLAALSYLCRRVAPQTHWFHEPIGAGLLALLTGVIPAVVQAVQAGGVHVAIVVPALTGAVLSLLASSNPTLSASPATDAVRVPTLPPDAGVLDVRLLLGLGFMSAGILGLVFVLGGCAPGADGLRQACTNADAIIASGYQATIAWDREEENAIRALVSTDAQAARSRFEAHKLAAEKALGVLDRAVTDKKKACDVLKDENAKVDWASLLAAAIQVAADVKQALLAILPKSSRRLGLPSYVWGV